MSVSIDIENYLKHCLFTFKIIEKFRRIVKISQTNVDTFVPSNEEVINAYKRLKDEKYKLMF